MEEESEPSFGSTAEDCAGSSVPGGGVTGPSQSSGNDRNELPRASILDCDRIDRRSSRRRAIAHDTHPFTFTTKATSNRPVMICRTSFGNSWLRISPIGMSMAMESTAIRNDSLSSVGGRLWPTSEVWHFLVAIL
jgi:hypothetical protein